ncbi:Peptidoglycan-N-acetylglucosamine deacetylase [Halorhabdus sp. SVX81]|uniref:polysaccharide deacetylase family protein n=1 Tax=Halorhabdus sp. SVX81 TaxID=2978283 RepID=UPI0023DB0824|nr:polysaccharide deacetylase family protein [Halorhabdus sp. SVX81]WEL18491.1 Peptidoglycan-N-acetylglucosamine deacetylase [Halorhabdus sp. SVX81]
MTDRRAVLSIDVELFSQTPAYRNANGSAERAGIGLDGLSFLRDALAEHDARSTGFIVSELADSHPGAIRAFADAGHEIGSHTHTHRLLSALDSATQREEIERSRKMLIETTGRNVHGFRAPAFDLADDHFEVLAQAGYTYDSSIVSSRAIPGWYGGEYDVHRPTPATGIDADAPADMRELPVSVMPGLRLPLTGTWLRFFGPRYTILGMRWLARRGITPILYVHPWECVELPDVEGVPSRVYWHTGAWMRRAIERILSSDFRFVSAREVVESGTGEDGPKTDGGE